MVITEDYCPKEIYRLLMQKGFEGEFHTTYNDEGYTQPSVTIQTAMKWLREAHKLVITVSIGNENNKGNTDYSNPDRWFYFFDITNAKGVVIDTEYDPLSNEFSTYEESCEAAIRYCLEHLI